MNKTVLNMLEKYNLDANTYEKVIQECADKVNKITDVDWQDIVDKYELGIHYDSLRKGCTGIFGSVFVKEYFEDKYAHENVEDDILQKIDSKRLNLEKEKVKYRDERNAWNRNMRNEARLETTLSILEDEMRKLGKINFRTTEDIPVVNNGKDMIICLSDLHIGQAFNSSFGRYNSDIAVNRLEAYIEKIREASKTHNISKVHVVSLGDQISGNIHKSIAITNRENVIEQVKKSIELISSFCYEMCSMFEQVDFYNVVGNHSRIDRKEDSLHSERLDDLIGWCVNLSLEHISNFNYIDKNIDNGIADIDVCGKHYLAVHGDFDSMSRQGVSDLSMFVGFIPYAVLRGHMHSPAMNEYNGVKIIQSGSLAGSGDDYTVEKRLIGKPSQTLLICDNKGIDCMYHVELD